MKQTAVLRFIASLVLFVLLNACTGVVVKDAGFENTEAYQDRADKLAGISAWGFAGKISLDDGDQGGSGKLRWDVKADSSTLDFHAAMGRAAWHLEIGPGRAFLKEASGAEQTAGDVNELIQQRIGWPLPVDSLKWWVRGLAAPGRIDHQVIDADGQLINLQQDGWNVEFSRYDLTEGMVLPKRLNATKDNYRVKLAISRWQMDAGHVVIN